MRSHRSSFDGLHHPDTGVQYANEDCRPPWRIRHQIIVAMQSVRYGHSNGAMHVAGLVLVSLTLVAVAHARNW